MYTQTIEENIETLQHDNILYLKKTATDLLQPWTSSLHDNNFYPKYFSVGSEYFPIGLTM